MKSHISSGMSPITLWTQAWLACMVLSAEAASLGKRDITKHHQYEKYRPLKHLKRDYQSEIANSKYTTQSQGDSFIIIEKLGRIQNIEDRLNKRDKSQLEGAHKPTSVSDTVLNKKSNDSNSYEKFEDSHNDRKINVHKISNTRDQYDSPFFRYNGSHPNVDSNKFINETNTTPVTPKNFQDISTLKSVDSDGKSGIYPKIPKEILKNEPMSSQRDFRESAPKSIMHVGNISGDKRSELFEIPEEKWLISKKHIPGVEYVTSTEGKHWRASNRVLQNKPLSNADPSLSKFAKTEEIKPLKYGKESQEIYWEKPKQSYSDKFNPERDETGVTVIPLYDNTNESTNEGELQQFLNKPFQPVNSNLGYKIGNDEETEAFPGMRPDGKANLFLPDQVQKKLSPQSVTKFDDIDSGSDEEVIPTMHADEEAHAFLYKDTSEGKMKAFGENAQPFIYERQPWRVGTMENVPTFDSAGDIHGGNMNDEKDHELRPGSLKQTDFSGIEKQNPLNHDSSNGGHSFQNQDIDLDRKGDMDRLNLQENIPMHQSSYGEFNPKYNFDEDLGISKPGAMPQGHVNKNKSNLLSQNHFTVKIFNNTVVLINANKHQPSYSGPKETIPERIQMIPVFDKSDDNVDENLLRMLDDPQFAKNNGSAKIETFNKKIETYTFQIEKEVPLGNGNSVEKEYDARYTSQSTHSIESEKQQWQTNNNKNANTFPKEPDEIKSQTEQTPEIVSRFIDSSSDGMEESIPSSYATSEIPADANNRNTVKDMRTNINEFPKFGDEKSLSEVDLFGNIPESGLRPNLPQGKETSPPDRIVKITDNKIEILSRLNDKELQTLQKTFENKNGDNIVGNEMGSMVPDATGGNAYNPVKNFVDRPLDMELDNDYLRSKATESSFYNDIQPNQPQVKEDNAVLDKVYNEFQKGLDEMKSFTEQSPELVSRFISKRSSKKFNHRKSIDKGRNSKLRVGKQSHSNMNAAKESVPSSGREANERRNNS